VSEQTTYRVLGVCTMILGACYCIVGILNIPARIAGVRDLSFFIYAGVILVIFGFLSYRIVHWAGWLLAIVSFLLGIFMLVGSISEVPMPWMTFNIFFSCIAMFPFVNLIRHKFFKKT
jgi:hypothetical protein